VLVFSWPLSRVLTRQFANGRANIVQVKTLSLSTDFRAILYRIGWDYPAEEAAAAAAAAASLQVHTGSREHESS